MGKIANSYAQSSKVLHCFALILMLPFLYIASPAEGLDDKAVEDFNLGTVTGPQAAQGNAKDVNPAHVVHWTAKGSFLHPDGSVVVQLNLRTDNDFTLYAEHLQFTSRSGLDLIKIIPPPAKEIDDPVTGKLAQVYSGGDFILQFQGNEKFDKPIFPLTIRYIACTIRICLFPYTEEIQITHSKTMEALPAALTSGTASKPSSPSLEAPSNPKSTQSKGANETYEERLAERLQLGDLGLAMLLLALFLGGLLTNLTPCVYPMIPITIRLLGNQKRHPVQAATAYAVGIVVVYSVLGLSVAYTGTLFGQYMANPWVNTALALVMFLLGFSMLGFGQWNFIANLGNKLGISKPGLGQAFLMGCGAGLVASPCTGPILASILTYIVANKDLGRSTLYIFTYSVGFALPYIVLGGLSGELSKKKISHKIQILVKVGFAAIMFALSFYYMRIPFYKAFAEWRPYWQATCLVSLLLGLLVWRMMWIAQKRKAVKWFMVLPGLLLGVSIFSGTQWVFDAKVDKPRAEQILWYDNETEALELAKQQGNPLLIDFWAEWCAACKKMDSTTFVDEYFINETKKQNWIFLKLDVTQDTPANTQLLEKYKVQGLPTIVILKPGAAETVKVSGYASAARLLNYFN